MARTTTFSLRLSKELRESIEKNAKILRIKPSVLAAMIIKDSMDDWIKDYAETIYNTLYPKVEEIR